MERTSHIQALKKGVTMNVAIPTKIMFTGPHVRASGAVLIPTLAYSDLNVFKSDLFIQCTDRTDIGSIRIQMRISDGG